MFRTNVLFGLCAVVAFGCKPPSPKSAADISGEYMFQYQTGEIEDMVLYPDFTYRQALYRTAAGFHDDAPTDFTNRSTWSYRDNHVIMSKWMVFSDWPNNIDKLRSNPGLSDSFEGAWFPATKTRDAVILFAENAPRDYAFIRITNKNTSLGH